MRRIAVSVIFACALCAVPAALCGAEESPALVLQDGHSRGVWQAALSPDGSLCASAGMDNTIRLWDVRNGRLLRVFTGHTDQVQSVGFSPDGKRIVSGGFDRTVRMWEVATGKALSSTPAHGGFVRSVGFSRGGSFFFSVGQDGDARIWDASSCQVLRTFKVNPGDVFAAVLGPDDSTLAVGGEDGSIRAWDVSSGTLSRTLREAGRTVNALAFSPDGRFLAGAGAGSAVTLWDTRTGKAVKDLSGSTEGYDGLAFSPDGRTLACASWAGTVDLWAVPEGTKAGSVKAFSEPGKSPNVNAVAYCPDGRTLVSSSGRALQAWETAGLTEKWRALGRTQPLESVAIDGAGKVLAAAGRDGAVHLWDAGTGRLIRSIGGWDNAVSALSFSPDGSSLAVGSFDGTVRSFSMESGRQIARADMGGSVYCAAFAPDGTRLAVGGGDRALDMLDPRDLRVTKTVPCPSYIRALAFSHDGSLLACGDEKGGVTIRAAASAEQTAALPAHIGTVLGVLFSPDDRRLYTCGADKTVRIWDVGSASLLRTIRGFSSAVTSLAVSPDGTRLHAGCGNGELVACSPDSGRILARTAAHGGAVTGLLFGRANGLLYSCSADSTVKAWDAGTGSALVTMVCIADRDYVAYTAEGYFAASSGGAEIVNVVRGVESLPLDASFETRYRPDLVAARLQALPPPAPAAPAFAAPPDVSMEIERADGSFRGLSTVAVQSAYRVVDGTVKVRIAAADRGGGVAGVRLFLNGKVAGEDFGAGAARAAFTVSLAEGDNLLRAVGFSRDRTESDPVEAVLPYAPQRTVKPTLWILAIGINQYRNSRYNLNFAVGDADGFLRSVRKPAGRLFDAIEATRIVDQAALKAGVLEAFRTIADRARPEDVFIFFYAGHGIALDGAKPGENDFYFILSDLVQMTSAEQVARAGLSGAEYRGLVARIKAQKQFQVIDACNAGALSEAFAMRGAAEEIALARLSRSTGSVLIAASQANQNAQEFTSLGHGALTEALIEGLSGKAASADGQITATRLKTWAEESMPALTRKYSGVEQFPTGFAYGQDFPIGLAGGK